MPIFWILVVSVLLYLALQQMDKQYAAKNKKPPSSVLPTVRTRADASAAEDGSALEKSIDGISFIDTIPGLSRETKEELRQLVATTSQSIRDLSDEKLLAVKGIGLARLKQIRSLCANTKKQ